MLAFLELWSSYSLVDFIPIELETYLRLFIRANNALWPLPLLIIFFGLIFLVNLIRRKSNTLYLYCAAAWLFSAYQFHFSLLNELHWIGYYFGCLFVIQAALLLLFYFQEKSKPAIGKPVVTPEPYKRILGLSIILFGLILYPLIPFVTNRPLESAEIVGIAPDPTCLVTIGILLATNRARWWLLAIPLLWSILSGVVSYAMSVFEGVLWVFTVLVLIALLLPKQAR